MASDEVWRMRRQSSSPSPPGTMISSRKQRRHLLLGFGDHPVGGGKGAHAIARGFQMMPNQA